MIKITVDKLNEIMAGELKVYNKEYNESLYADHNVIEFIVRGVHTLISRELKGEPYFNKKETSDKYFKEVIND